MLDRTVVIQQMSARRVADVLEVFLAGGVNGVLGCRLDVKPIEAVQNAQDRTGCRLHLIAPPSMRRVARDRRPVIRRIIGAPRAAGSGSSGRRGRAGRRRRRRLKWPTPPVDTSG